MFTFYGHIKSMTHAICTGLPSHPSHVSVCTSAPAIEYHSDSLASLLTQLPELHFESYLVFITCTDKICYITENNRKTT